MILILALIFATFTLAYLFIAAAVLYHLWHYTLPGWNAARFAVPAFFTLSAILFILAGYFLLNTPR